VEGDRKEKTPWLGSPRCRAEKEGRVKTIVRMVERKVTTWNYRLKVLWADNRAAIKKCGQGCRPIKEEQRGTKQTVMCDTGCKRRSGGDDLSIKLQT